MLNNVVVWRVYCFWLASNLSKTKLIVMLLY